MFGRPDKTPPPPARVPASDIARIQGGGLVQVIVTKSDPLTYFLFLNDQQIAQDDVESLLVNIQAPASDDAPTTVQATLAYSIPAVTGGKGLIQRELLPCTLELIAEGRRVSLTAIRPNSLEGLWIDLGLKPDGTSNEVSGAQSLRILITDGILDARVTWTDGVTENLLEDVPQAGPASTIN